MIVRNYFDGDSNYELKSVQADSYLAMLGQLVRRARERYLEAATLLEVTNELVSRLQTSFDHRTLQAAHDKAAAYYRYAMDPRGQMPLGLDVAEWRAQLKREWEGYFQEEAASLCRDPEIVRAVLNATAFGNTETGYDAEEELSRLLDERYGTLGLARHGESLGGSGSKS